MRKPKRYETPEEETLAGASDVLWRYMDIPSFLSLVQTGRLFFAHPSIFQDKFEAYAANAAFGPRPGGPSGGASYLEWFRNEHRSHREKLRQWGVSCWYESKNESVLMWKAFAKGEMGVVIKSSGSRLCSAFAPCPTWLNGPFRVRYTAVQPGAYSIRDALTIKRKEFVSENEARMIVDESKMTADEQVSMRRGDALGIDARFVTQFADDPNPRSVGYGVKINLTKLIKKVLVSPFAKPHVVTAVGQYARPYGIKVEQSPAQGVDGLFWED